MRMIFFIAIRIYFAFTESLSGRLLSVHSAHLACLKISAVVPRMYASVRIDILLFLHVPTVSTTRTYVPLTHAMKACNAFFNCTEAICPSLVLRDAQPRK